MPITLVVHGGAWDIPDEYVAENEAGIRAALAAGWQVLQAGGSALDAVEAATLVMEDNPIYDAGIGSVLNRDGYVELDAAIMDGATMRAGAVAGLRRIRNPVTLARRVLESNAVMLVAEGAERFAEEQGIPFCDPAELIVERERLIWEKLRDSGNYQTQDAFGGHDTVGAVALDAAGNIAAATTTGGTAYKLPGRVGDSPLVGSGLYADNASAACSTTGWGESIIKVVLAKHAADLVAAKRDPQQAAEAALATLKLRVGGLGGLILLDAKGRIGMAHNTPRMACGYRTADGQEFVSVKLAHITRESAK